MGGLGGRDSIRYTRTAGEGVQDFYVTTNGLSAGLPFAVAPPRRALTKPSLEGAFDALGRPACPSSAALLPCCFCVPTSSASFVGCPVVRRVIFGRNASRALSWMQVVVTVM